MTTTGDAETAVCLHDVGENSAEVPITHWFFISFHILSPYKSVFSRVVCEQRITDDLAKFTIHAKWESRFDVFKTLQQDGGSFLSWDTRFDDLIESSAPVASVKGSDQIARARNAQAQFWSGVQSEKAIKAFLRRMCCVFKI